eukprot:9074282-Alexandrium_andersonii.AAC.1
MERQHREVVEVGVLDVHQVPEEVPGGCVAVVPLRREATLLQCHPPIHPCNEKLEDVVDLHPEPLVVLVQEA